MKKKLFGLHGLYKKNQSCNNRLIIIVKVITQGEFYSDLHG